MDVRDDRPAQDDGEEVDEATRAAERAESFVTARADRMPTPEEEELAERQPLDPDVAEHEREMMKRGAHQEGEGRIP